MCCLRRMKGIMWDSEKDRYTDVGNSAEQERFNDSNRTVVEGCLGT